MEINIRATIKRIKFKGMCAYLPVLIVDNKIRHVSKGDPLVTKESALKYAHIWRNESIACGYITYS